MGVAGWGVGTECVGVGSEAVRQVIALARDEAAVDGLEGLGQQQGLYPRVAVVYKWRNHVVK